MGKENGKKSEGVRKWEKRDKERGSRGSKKMEHDQDGRRKEGQEVCSRMRGCQ